MLLHWDIILLWFCIHINVTQCCMKSGGSGGGSTPQKPTKSGGSGGSSSFQKPTTTPATKSGHRLPCSAPEVHTANCRNGGTCYVVLLRSYRTTVCSCSAEWQGEHCERRYIDPRRFEVKTGSTGATVWIVLGVAAGVITVLVVILVIYFRKRPTSDILPKMTKMTKRQYKPVTLSTISPSGSEMSQFTGMTQMNGYHHSAGYEPDTYMSPIPENELSTLEAPELRHKNSYYNRTLSNESIQRNSTMSAVSNHSTMLYESAV